MKKFLTLSLLFVFALITGAFAQTNIAPLGKIIAVIPWWNAESSGNLYKNMIDGNNATGFSFTLTDIGLLTVDLQTIYSITAIEITSDYSFAFSIGLDRDSGYPFSDPDLDNNVPNTMINIPGSPINCRYIGIRIDIPDNNVTGDILEFKIYGTPIAKKTTVSNVIASPQGEDLWLNTGNTPRLTISNSDGSVTALGSVTATKFIGDGSQLTGTSPWATNAKGIYMNWGGNVGINNAAQAPGANLSFGNVNDGRNTPDGITWYSPAPLSYGIYRTSGAWSSPNYQQLQLAWSTGIVIDGGSTYGKSGTVLQPNGGNVLIGKSSQTNTAYKLDIAGKLRANEVTVNTTGADFVFENNYKLCPLADLENFIKQHKHLPEISPAIEMQTNGMSMGEMQTRLLQKIEELTLYSIEQDKKLKEQAGQNAKLQKEIKELKELIMKKLK